MKLTFLLLFAFNLQLFAKGYAQAVFTLDMKNVVVEEVLNRLQNESDYRFFYNSGQIKTLDRVTVVVKDETLPAILGKVLGQKFDYKILEDNLVIISPKNNMFLSVHGVVTDDKGNPLAGVSVIIKGTSKGITTNAEGRYVLDADAKDVLVFSMVGYEPQEIAVAGKTFIDVQLNLSASSLNQVVVVGYGTARKKDLTGSVGSVNMKELQKAPVRSFEEALTGRLAGVTASADDGQPGASINIVIRGNNSITQDNSPLYVIDGFPLENPDNNAINPAEIESIEVLKDASSTAIYGARGANGVIVITTKKGKVGKPVITYNGYVGFQQNHKKAELMNPYEFVKLQSEIDSLNTDSTYLVDGKTFDYYKNIKGIDIQDSIFQTTPIRKHFINLTGGTADTKYSISGSAFNQTGILTNSGYDRYQGRIRLDQRVNKNLNVGINTNYSNMKQYGTSPAQDGNGFYYGNLLFSVWSFRPVTANLTQPDDVDEDDETFLALQGFNPLKTARNALRRKLSDVLTTDAYAEYSFAKNFRLRVTGGLTKTKIRNEVFNNTQTPTGSPLTKAGADNGVNGSLIYNEITNWVNENTLSYSKQVSRASLINTVIGFTMSGTNASSYGASANHIPNEDLGISGIDEGTPIAITSTSSSYKLASFLGRVNYTLLSKYLFTASFRADGSSKFAPANRWSYFPSGAIAWRLSDEAFMQPLRFISNAKVRLSYGSTGNNRVSDFAYLSRISLPSSVGYSYYNEPVVAAVLSSLGNVNLKWETTNQTDIGLDLGFFDQRISLEADVYRKVTSNLLLDASLPGSMGFSTALKNIGKVQNQGLELTLNTANVRNRKFSWSSNFNISFNRNKVLALSDGENIRYTNAAWDTYTSGVPLYIAEIGHPIAMFWGYIWDGNYQYTDFDETSPGVYSLKSGVASYPTSQGNPIQPGNIKLRDINGDGTIDADDRTVIGNPNPDFTGGFSNDFTYKNFDLSVFFAFSYGNDVININRIIMEGQRVRKNMNYFATYANRWTPENQNNEYFRLNGGGPLEDAYTTRVIEDGSYLKLKTVQLGYNFPQKLIRRVKLSNLRLYASAQNLLTFTKYSGFDPEVSKFGSSALRPAFDYSVYPHARTITFGLNVSF
ncbi:MAG: SusC/RagA family TonB-linked outer membrane protein [Flavisolibacter sp.]